MSNGHTYDLDDRSAAALESLRAEGYQPLWSAVRRRLESNGLVLGGTPVRVQVSTDRQRRSICGLLGRSAATGSTIKVGLVELDEVLRNGAVSTGLIAVLHAIGGPLDDRVTTRRGVEQARASAWAAVDAHPTLQVRPALVGWVTTLRSTGGATRIAGNPVAGAELVVRALGVIGTLPAQNVGLAALAADLTGDAHALDRDTPLGKLMSSALEVLDDEMPVEGDLDAPAWWWRRRWARQGVVCDDLSVSVLVLNLPVRSDGDMIATAIQEHAFGGEPLRLTLRQLAVGELTVPHGCDVFVCENPSVVAQAAQLLEGRSAPLVCVEGQPNTAAGSLLDALTAQGCRLHYHGDFDWGGLKIARSVLASPAASPWRFGADDYRAAAGLGRIELPSCPPTLLTPWDDELVSAMATAGVAVYEEQVLGDLLTDLGSPTQRPAG